jgi:hypothetical protein
MTVLLFHGEERFLIDEAARATLDAWKPELVSDFGLDILEGTALTTARLQDSILQAPFLDPFRAVYARMLPAQRAESAAAALQEIPRPPACSSPSPAASARATSSSKPSPRPKGRRPRCSTSRVAR